MSTKPGLNLADLAPMHEDVPVGDNFLRVHGVSAKQGLEILARFPKITGMVSGDKFNLSAFLTAAPDAVAAIIAAASGQLGQKDAEANAATLPIDVQFDIMEAVGRLTFTKGFAPFVEKLTALLSSSGANSVLSGKATDLRSPPVSKPSSLPDMLPM